MPKPDALWAEEVKKLGAKAAIEDRLHFHAGLPLEDIVRNTGLATNTVMKHIKKLIEEGFVRESEFTEGYYRHTRKGDQW